MAAFQVEYLPVALAGLGKVVQQLAAAEEAVVAVVPHKAVLQFQDNLAVAA